ncbi:hypothetical protein [Ornithinibacillus sp. 179-J 7C1 HS]|uniref:hypothetical protein n=1 Tax=Ornithinibacillus sp. 179-J 7C1 HS TaxID=3142384 RepID=UPI0039A2723C
MASIGIIGFLFSLIAFIIPLVLIIFILIWIHQIKVNSENQVKQNNEIIKLLEELNNK